MKYFFLFLFTLFFIPHYSFAEPPDWVTNQGKSVKHPEQLYLTGFGISTVTKNMSKEDALQSAVANSRRNLIEKVRVSVSNTVSMYAEENNEHVSSNIKIATQTTSSLDLHGLKNEQYFDDEDELWYAFAFVAKEQLNGAYEEKSEHIRKEIS
ncbi:MAG: LPP20 family lipoprotein, partial [Bacteroidetes bacterium]|nr:LPP20 family lipoprotein [Bacteroidota bacterium]